MRKALLIIMFLVLFTVLSGFATYTSQEANFEQKPVSPLIGRWESKVGAIPIELVFWDTGVGYFGSWWFDYDLSGENKMEWDFTSQAEVSNVSFEMPDNDTLITTATYVRDSASRKFTWKRKKV